MKKNFFFYLFIIVINNALVCQNFLLDGEYPFQEDSMLEEMKIHGNTIILDYKDAFSKKKDEELTFEIKYIDGLTFLEISEKMPKEIAEYKNWKNQKELIQTNNKILFLACQRNCYTLMFAFTEGYSFDNSPLTRTRYDEWGSQYTDCSSYLIEKSKSYPVENLRKLVVDTPWVEAGDGDGIGEGFTIKCTSRSEPLGPYLLIMNGYISYDKPYLYKQNNRVKKIKVSGLKSKKTKILDLLDTPHPQTVDISFFTIPEDIRIEIADVYKGTKYNDTCLHYCINFNEEVIPYENSIDE